jgi:hypothetical protein
MAGFWLLYHRKTAQSWLQEISLRHRRSETAAFYVLYMLTYSTGTSHNTPHFFQFSIFYTGYLLNIVNAVLLSLLPQHSNTIAC